MPLTLKPLLTFQGPLDGAPIDIAAHVESFKPKSERDKVEFANFLDLVKKVEKGRYSNEIEMNLKPRSVAVLSQFIVWYRGEGDVQVVFRHNRDQGIGPDNPELTFSVAVTDAVLPGGDGGSQIEKSVTWTINSPISYNDGTTTVEIGG